MLSFLDGVCIIWEERLSTVVRTAVLIFYIWVGNAVISVLCSSCCDFITPDITRTTSCNKEESNTGVTTGMTASSQETRFCYDGVGDNWRVQERPPRLPRLVTGGAGQGVWDRLEYVGDREGKESLRLSRGLELDRRCHDWGGRVDVGGHGGCERLVIPARRSMLTFVCLNCSRLIPLCSSEELAIWEGRRDGGRIVVCRTIGSWEKG